MINGPGYLLNERLFMDVGQPGPPTQENLMCSHSELPCISLLLWWPRFWSAFHTEQARMHAVLSGNRQRQMSHKPLLSLHVGTLKVTGKPLDSEQKPNVWLVKPTGE
jgi:hypothetical protein